MLQNYFELPSEEIFFKIAHRCGILIQETARSDSILARFRLIHCSRASFATQSDEKRKCSKRRRLPQQLRQLGDVGGDAPRFVAGELINRRSASRLLLVEHDFGILVRKIKKLQVEET